MSALKLDLLAAAVGDYCREFKDELYSKLLFDMDSQNHMTVLDNVKDELVLTNLNISNLIKPFNQTFQPTADALYYEPRILKVRAFKIDLQLFAKELHKTWMAMMKRQGADPYNLPFEAYLMSKIVEQGKMEIEEITLFNGVYNGSGTAPIDVTNGFVTLLDLEEDDGNLAGVDIAVISVSNAVQEFEKVVDEIPTKYLSKELKCFVSSKNKRLYEQCYRNTHGALPYNKQFEKNYLDGTKIELVPCAGMPDTKFFIAPQTNVIVGTDSRGDIDSLIVEREKRNINVMLDAVIGCQFRHLEEVWYGRPAIIP